MGRIKVLFVSPERLNNLHLLEALRPLMPLPLLVVDEAHCVAGGPVLDQTAGHSCQLQAAITSYGAVQNGATPSAQRTSVWAPH